MRLGSITIDPRYHGRIFERFYRPGNELRRETTGYGLGLFLVQELTHSPGGQVRAMSAGPGQGACLTYTCSCRHPVPLHAPLSSRPSTNPS